MEWFNLIAGFCSITSLVISLFAINKVNKIVNENKNIRNNSDDNFSFSAKTKYGKVEQAKEIKKNR